MKRIVISQANLTKMALRDLWEGLITPTLWWEFALHEVKQRFRRSALGPFWLTLSLGIMILTLGFLSTKVFNRGDDQLVYPSIATGLIMWTFLNTALTESSQAFIIGQGHIRNVPIPLSINIYRTIAQNFIILGYNMLIYVGILIFFPKGSIWGYLLFIPGFFLFILNLVWMGLVIGIFSARFRDIPPIVASILQIFFFITPVFWTADSFSVKPVFITWNPAHHLLDIVRSPLLGKMPEGLSWVFVCIFSLLGISFTMMLYRRSYSRIPYWI